MAHAYAPGLTVAEYTLFRKERRLPLKGTVIVRKGDKVKALQNVARTELPGAVYPINMAHKLGIGANDVPDTMKVPLGGAVTKGQVIAHSSSFFGLFSASAPSPIDGTVESVSKVTGQVMLRAKPVPVELNAFMDGEVVEVIENEGVVVETWATFIQGIFGIGGEVHGPIKMLTNNPDTVLDASMIDDSCAGHIVVGGSLVTIDAINKALKVKALGIIAGGINDADLRELLGYDLGVAVTGNEDKGLTVIVTEGFGKIRMADRTFRLISTQNGRNASINGATQIRAGVMRPEIVIPVAHRGEASKSTKEAGAMVVGSQLRLIRDPYFGALAKVVSLPHALTVCETEAKVRVVEVELVNGERVTLPRANVELIED